ncbi:hypothetical protein ACRAQ6_05560 [Erythrobacter sp. HA6-11]
MMRKTLVITSAALLLGSTAAQAKDDGLGEAYVEAMECRVAASMVLKVRKSDNPSEEELALVAKMETVDAFYGSASLWLGEKLGKDADRVKAEYALGILGATSRVMESRDEVMQLARTADTCGNAIQEAEA